MKKLLISTAAGIWSAICIAQISDSEAIATLKKYSTCVVRKKHDEVVQWTKLLVGVGSTKLTLDNDCLAQGKIAMPTAMVRGSIFIALYKADMPKNVKITFDKEMAIKYADPSTWGAKWDNAYDLAIVGLQSADCVVKSDPDHARDFVLNSSNLMASSALEPWIVRCFGSHGKMSEALKQPDARFALAGMMAEPLYRRSVLAGK